MSNVLFIIEAHVLKDIRRGDWETTSYEFASRNKADIKLKSLENHLYNEVNLDHIHDFYIITNF